MGHAMAHRDSPPPAEQRRARIAAYRPGDQTGRLRSASGGIRQLSRAAGWPLLRGCTHRPAGGSNAKETSMTLTLVPSVLEAAQALGPIISEHADEAERERRLSREVVDALARAGLLSMCAPTSLGGLE